MFRRARRGGETGSRSGEGGQDGAGGPDSGGAGGGGEGEAADGADGGADVFGDGQGGLVGRAPPTASAHGDEGRDGRGVDHFAGGHEEHRDDENRVSVAGECQGGQTGALQYG